MSNKNKSLDVHSPTSTKTNASVHAALDHSPTLPTESAKPAAPTASHACLPLSVPPADPDTTSKTVSVSSGRNALELNSNTTEFA